MPTVQCWIYHCLPSIRSFASNCWVLGQTHPQILPYCCSRGCCGVIVLVCSHLWSSNSYAGLGPQRRTWSYGESRSLVSICGTSNYTIGTYTWKNGSLGRSCVEALETPCQQDVISQPFFTSFNWGFCHTHTSWAHATIWPCVPYKVALWSFDTANNFHTYWQTVFWLCSFKSSSSPSGKYPSICYIMNWNLNNM